MRLRPGVGLRLGACGYGITSLFPTLAAAASPQDGSLYTAAAPHPRERFGAASPSPDWASPWYGAAPRGLRATVAPHYPTLAASAYLQDGLLNCVLMSKCRLMYCYMPPQRPTPAIGAGHRWPSFPYADPLEACICHQCRSGLTPIVNCASILQSSFLLVSGDIK